MHQLNYFAFFLFGILIIYSNGSMIDRLQKEKENLKSTLSFLDMLESTEPDEPTSQCKLRPTNCAEILLQGKNESGIYTVYPRYLHKAEPFIVYCDMTTDGGGWTVFQRRGDYEIQENFYRRWKDYKRGFGSLERDFWLGNSNLYLLTNTDIMTLRIDLEDFDGNKRFAHYHHFRIDNDDDSYKLSVSDYTGDAGDHFSSLNGVKFVTFNRNDDNSCSKVYKGGWWYTKCHGANLNGLYLRGNHSSYADGINWQLWKGYHYSLKNVEMKIRPVSRSEFED